MSSAYSQEDISQNQAITDSLLTPSDTASSDSIPAPKAKSNSGFNSKVEYKAQDSMRFDVANQKVYLYGGGEVYYETTSLKADYIELNIQTNEVKAHGVEDTAGNITGKPVFTDKDQEFEADDMKYNFQTKKGLITEALTQHGDGYIVGGLIKKHPDDVIYIKDGRLCPCEDRDARTFIKARKIKIIPEDKIVTGAANMKIGHIPTPLVLPFSILPNKKGAASGILLPEYGYSPDQGLFFKNGGFYWHVNQKLNLSFTGEIFSRGSWGVGLAAGYKERYKYTGNVDLRYANYKTGILAEEVSEQNIYKIFWKHTQDPKANPYQSFNADVNIYKNNRIDINNTANEYLSNNFKSNLNYTRKFGNSPFRLTANASFEQNQQDTNQTAQLTLPNLTLNMDRIFPFKRKFKVGKDKWYEKIGMTYTTDFRNTVKGNPDDLLTTQALDDMNSGFKHTIGLKTSYKLMKVFAWQPYINYTEHWETKKLEQYWSDADTAILNDTIREFGRYGIWDAGMTMSTKIYGMVTYRRGPVKAIRHVMTPSVGFTYTPDYTNQPYVQELYYSQDSLINTYSSFTNAFSPFRTAPIGPQTGKLNMALRNNFEMNVANKKDTINGEKKIKLLDQLNFTTNYDLFADTMNWDPISIIANTNLLNFFRINYSSVLDPYALQVDTSISAGAVRVDQFELNENGTLGRFVNHRLGINFTLGNKKMQQRRKAQQKSRNQSPYIYQNIPWSLSIGYTYNYSKPYFEDSKVITQSLQLQAKVDITQNWKFEGMTNYDFEANDFGYTRFSLYRDMNCWEARITVVPKGGQQNYNFSINLKPQMFKDMKVERKRNFYDFQ